MHATLEQLSKDHDADRDTLAELPVIRATLDQHTQTLAVHTAKLEELAALKNKLIGAAVLGGVMFSSLIMFGRLVLDQLSH